MVPGSDRQAWRDGGAPTGYRFAQPSGLLPHAGCARPLDRHSRKSPAYRLVFLMFQPQDGGWAGLLSAENCLANARRWSAI